MRTVALFSMFLLAACATGPDRTAVLNSMVGQSETEAVRTLGVPSRSYETGGRKFLAYREERATVLDGGGGFFGGGFYGGGFGYGTGFGPGFGPSFGYGAAFPTEVIPRVCETTLEVAGGRVTGWSLRGNACG